MMRLRIYYPVFVAAALVVVLHVVLAASDKTYYMTQITMSTYYALVVIGLCLLMGYAGQVSLGHAGFFAIGGYTVAVLTTCNLSNLGETPAMGLLRSLGLLVQWQDLYGRDILSFAPWPAFAAAMLLTALIALAIGLPVIRPVAAYLYHGMVNRRLRREGRSPKTVSGYSHKSRSDYLISNRSRFITLHQAATKSRMNFSSASDAA